MVIAMYLYLGTKVTILCVVTICVHVCSKAAFTAVVALHTIILLQPCLKVDQCILLRT